MEHKGMKIMAKNRQVYHDYFVEEEYEAGIELFGTEVKSIRAGTLNLKDAWCGIKDGELFVNQMHISPYEKGNIFNKDPLPSPPLADAQAGDQPSLWQGEAGRVCPHPHLCVLQKCPGEGLHRPV